MLSERNSNENDDDLPLLFPTLKYSGRFRDDSKTSNGSALVVPPLTIANILTIVRCNVFTLKHRSTPASCIFLFDRNTPKFDVTVTITVTVTVPVPVPLSVTVTIHQQPNRSPRGVFSLFDFPLLPSQTTFSPS